MEGAVDATSAPEGTSREIEYAERPAEISGLGARKVNDLGLRLLEVLSR